MGDKRNPDGSTALDESGVPGTDRAAANEEAQLDPSKTRSPDGGSAIDLYDLGEPPSKYDEWTVEEIKAELRSRDLPVSGKDKAELVARLDEDDAE